MGVPGLWEVLRPAGKLRSLTHIAVVDGFEANTSGRRGFRVGIDASIWFYHATYGKEGENPELRTLFFRCARLMSKPVLPLFVFDGPKRPDVKRKKKVSGKQHWLTSGMQQIIEAFGFEWRMAPGEAEAELAYLNRIGVIDAIISDDVDNFLFGAKMIIRNPGKMLSGNHAHPMKNSAGKDDDEHVFTYNSSDFSSHEDIGLSLGGLILIGLLRGGDYSPEGLPGCGPNAAHALARCGFGDTLLTATRTLSRDRFPAFLESWRHEVRQELRTNSRGYLNSKKAKLASALPESFPDIDILMLYTNPVTSESQSRSVSIEYTWEREPDLGKLAGVCEWFFEWGVKEIIVKRFRTVMWAPMVLRILRRSVLEADSRKKALSSKNEDNLLSTPRKTAKTVYPNSPGTPASMIARNFSSMRLSNDGDKDEEEVEDERLIQMIHSKREHASTDGIPEYRLEIAPAQLVRLTEAGVQGKRQPVESLDVSDNDEDDEDGDGKAKKKGGLKKPPPVPSSHLRIWMPASMVRIVEPDLVEEFEGIEERKKRKKQEVAERKAMKAQGVSLPPKAKAKPPSVRTKQSSSSKADRTPSGFSGSDQGEEDFSDVFGLKAGPSKRPGKKTSKAIRHIFEEEETEEEAEEELKDSSGPNTQAASKMPTKDKNRPLDSWFAKKKTGTSIRMKAPTKPETCEPSGSNILLDVLNKESLSKGTAVRETGCTGEISSITRAASVSSSVSKTLAPFPMSPSDFEDEWSINRQSISITSRVTVAVTKKSVRRHVTSTSNSDEPDQQSSSHKSPRKSKSQASPGRVASCRQSSRPQKQEEEETPEHRREKLSIKPLLAARARKPPAPVAKEEEESSNSSDDGFSRPVSPSPMRKKQSRASTEVAQKFKPTLKSQTMTPIKIIEISSDSDGSPGRGPSPTLASNPGRCGSAPTMSKQLLLAASNEVIDLT